MAEQVNISLADMATLQQNGGQNNNFTSILLSLDMERLVEGRGVLIAFGVISMLLALYVVYRIWLDSWRSFIISGKRKSR
jgi:hypothetical protein